MKTLTIGRNPENNIVLNDNMISRRHACLRIYSNGKYEIVSQGPNGTTVNGNLIVPNQPYPLKRGDVVIFAGHSKLDWHKVPDPLKPFKIAAIVCGAVALIVAAILIINLFRGSSNVYTGGSTPVDNTPVKTEKVDEQKEVSDAETPSGSTELLDEESNENLKAIEAELLKQQNASNSKPDKQTTSGKADNKAVGKADKDKKEASVASKDESQAKQEAEKKEEAAATPEKVAPAASGKSKQQPEKEPTAEEPNVNINGF